MARILRGSTFPVSARARDYVEQLITNNPFNFLFLISHVSQNVSHSSRTLKGKADSNQTKPLEMSQAMKDKMKKIYQCTVCLSLPLCNIYQCNEGHLICMDCHNKMETPLSCPTCRSQMPATPIRCRSAEQVSIIYHILNE